MILSLFLSLIPLFLAAQDPQFPLEQVVIDGSVQPRAAVMEIAGLKISAPINKAGMEAACKRLNDSGLFSSISFRYAPGPKHGYVLTLDLADQTPLAPAAIDLPGVDEEAVWRWLAAKFPPFDHRVPQAETAQRFLAGAIQQQFAGQLKGNKVIHSMETDLATRRLVLTFLPDHLPRLDSVRFHGNVVYSNPELNGILARPLENFDYTPRRFRTILDLNLRRAYEQAGIYQLKIEPDPPESTPAGIAVTVNITEGPIYQLGRVEFLGDNLPTAAMLAAAHFPAGKTADWMKIQQGIWEVERVVKRTGYFHARAQAERQLDDAAHRLDLRITVDKGPLYHLGEVRFRGLTPELERLARKLWKPAPGDPYDYVYPDEFLELFVYTADLRRIRNYKASRLVGRGDNVMDIELTFERR